MQYIVAIQAKAMHKGWGWKALTEHSPEAAACRDTPVHCHLLCLDSPSSPQAGLVSPENPEQLLIALEPEAASIYCRKLRLHQLIDLSCKPPANGLAPDHSIDSSFRQGERPQGMGSCRTGPGRVGDWDRRRWSRQGSSPACQVSRVRQQPWGTAQPGLQQWGP